MLRRVFTRALTTLNSPTADLYFADSCADWLRRGLVTRYAPTVFASATVRLVIRHDGRAGRASLRPRHVYLIDDAIDLDGADAALSRYWRFKLDNVERAAAARFLPGAAAAVVSSPALEGMIRARASGLDVRVLNPYWKTEFSSLSHHRADGPFRVAFLGSQVHGPDFAPLATMLRGFLDDWPEAELIVGGGHGGQVGHARARDLGAMGWRDWRAALPALQPHVALYPLAETPFNAARSLNKLIEHAVAGAAGLYARAWPGAALAVEAGAGLALGPDPAEWRAALDRLAANPLETREMAKAGAALAARLNDAEAQRRLWAELLEIDDGAQGVFGSD
ncbi:glycosyltransferase family 4 protein [Pikeienuella piscinae]|uniref:Glycosyltransferase family 4 protein n=1 Tax=Pikeienuella piscinae TaxID=2748098 RepID=A0A7L5BXE2_9RHOB|nr:glycosyltransferase family 4 protein [Pikeienuella piscinae]QIE55813.1 glycosyltransferase family 4 protein [Pikeienuella piscinae]